MSTLVSKDNDVVMKVHGHRVRVSVMSVTPEMAKEWLQKEHERNRHTPSVAARYTEDMLAGRWHWTPEPIIFDSQGKMIDGGNRLRAIVSSEATVQMTVWFDCPPEVVDNLNRGAQRSLRQADQMAGRNIAPTLYYMGRGLRMLDKRTTTVSDSEVRTAIEALKAPWDTLGPVVPHRGGNKLRAGCVLTLCVAWFAEPKRAEAFARELSSTMKREIVPGSTIRNFLRLYETKSGKNGAAGTRTDAEVMGAALRQYCSGRDLEYIRPTEDSWHHWRHHKEAVKVLG